MDLRRALTTAAAAAAVLTPVVLTAAPSYAAYAADAGPTASPGAAKTPATATAAPSGSASPSATAPSGTPASPAATTPGAPEPTPAQSTMTPGATPPPTTEQPDGPPDVTATPSVVPSSPPGGSPGASPGASPGTSPGASPGSSPGASPDVDSPNDVCDVADFDVSITGLPAAVRAGGTTEPFTVVLDNRAGTDGARVQFGMAVAFRDGMRDGDWLAAQKYISVRYYDWTAESWKDAGTGGGVYTYTDIEAGSRYEMRLRLVLAPDTPPGAAGALAFSTRWNFGGPPGSSACVYDNEWYRFQITASGAAPATAEVRPQGGSAPLVLRPTRQGEPPHSAPVEGALARTGSGADLTVVALLSTTAVVLGGGALLFATRRRA